MVMVLTQQIRDTSPAAGSRSPAIQRKDIEASARRRRTSFTFPLSSFRRSDNFFSAEKIAENLTGQEFVIPSRALAGGRPEYRGPGQII
jgi:hypothetical protein